MPNDVGWIKLHRKILNWEWYDCPATKDVFLHLLLTAQTETSNWHGITIERGQVITSISSIASKTGLSEKQVRTAISHLEKTNSITKKGQTKYTIFSIVGFDEYQLITQSRANNWQTSGEQTADKRQTNDEQTADNGQAKGDIIRIKEYKNTRIQEDCSINPLLSPTPRKATANPEPSDSFNRFWEAYPKKTSKQTALKAWNKLNPNDELVNTILASLEAQKKLPQWTKDNGQYIPYPASWLNGKRWEDEVTVDTVPPQSQPQTKVSKNPFLNAVISDSKK